MDSFNNMKEWNNIYEDLKLGEKLINSETKAEILLGMKSFGSGFEKMVNLLGKRNEITMDDVIRIKKKYSAAEKGDLYGKVLSLKEYQIIGESSCQNYNRLRILRNNASHDDENYAKASLQKIRFEAEEMFRLLCVETKLFESYYLKLPLNKFKSSPQSGNNKKSLYSWCPFVIVVVFLFWCLYKFYYIVDIYSPNDISSLNRDTVSSFLTVIFFGIGMGNILIYLSLKTKGYHLSTKFNKFKTVILSLVYGYAWTYVFTFLVLLFSYATGYAYKSSFIPHALEALLLGGINAINFYYNKKTKNMKAEEVKNQQIENQQVENVNQKKSLSNVMQRDLSTLNSKGGLFNQKEFVVENHEFDRIRCSKCNHEFDVNIAHVALGEKYEFQCPVCKLVMRKNKSVEMVEKELENKMEENQVTVLRGEFTKKLQGLQKQKSIDLQVLGLQQLNEQYNVNIILQDQQMQELQQFQDQQIQDQQQAWEQQQAQEQQSREQQQIQDQVTTQQQLQDQQSHDNFNTFGNFDNQVDLGLSFGSGFNDFNMF